MTTPATSAAVEKVIAGIDDPGIDARYPDGAHLVPADHPQHGQMVTRALLRGEPVVLVYPDGREIIFIPEATRGLVALCLLVVAGWTWLRRRHTPAAEVIQLPPRTRIEARDSSGLPLAA